MCDWIGYLCSLNVLCHYVINEREPWFEWKIYSLLSLPFNQFDELFGCTNALTQTHKDENCFYPFRGGINELYDNYYYCSWTFQKKEGMTVGMRGLFFTVAHKGCNNYSNCCEYLLMVDKNRLFTEWWEYPTGR